jgi:hypothetical protein
MSEVTLDQRWPRTTYASSPEILVLQEAMLQLLIRTLMITALQVILLIQRLNMGTPMSISNMLVKERIIPYFEHTFEALSI